MRSSYSHADSYYLGCCNMFNAFIFNYKEHINAYGKVEFKKIWHHPVFQCLRKTVNPDGLYPQNSLCAYCQSAQRAILKNTNNEENYRIKLESIEKFYEIYNKQYKNVEEIAGLKVLKTEDKELKAMA